MPSKFPRMTKSHLITTSSSKSSISLFKSGPDMNEALQAPVDTNNYKLDDKLSGPHKLIMQC